MTEITLFHNPRCSKSRQALALLEERGIRPQLRLYLEEPPDRQEVECLLERLGLPVRTLLRTTEEAYKRLHLADEHLNEAQLIDALLQEPKLLQRPIAVAATRAVIGRPPEKVLELLP